MVFQNREFYLWY